MKLKHIALVASLVMSSASAAHAAPVVKKITLTAQIGDSIFVSRPDGSGWYDHEELDATDRTQRAFSKTLPIRVWTKGAEFNISLARPLQMRGGSYEMREPRVVLSQPGGEDEVRVGAPLKVQQSTPGDGGYDQIHRLTVSARAPAQTPDGPSINGIYRGDLVVLFEPSAATP